MKVLAIDTSGLVAAVAVTENGQLLAEFKTQYKKTHSQMLMPMIDAMAKAIDLELGTIDVIGTAAGPGSFTGLRIGAATAKGLAFALGIPVAPVPTIEAMAWQLAGEPGIICPMMDARRGQVYAGAYRYVADADSTESPDDVMETVLAPCAISVEGLLEKLGTFHEPVIFLGDGVPVYRDVIDRDCPVAHRFAPLWKNRQSAAALADLAERYAKEGRTVSADAFAPEYLRASQAEREAAAANGSVAARKPFLSYHREAAKRAGEDGIVLCRMTAADAAEAARLEKACLGQEAWNEEQLAEAIERRDCLYIAAVKDGVQIGHAGIKAVMGEGEITNVCVDEAYRNRGIGRRLMDALMEGRVTLGIADCTLEVRASNRPARALYERSGFASEGIRPGFYADPADDAAIYWYRAVFPVEVPEENPHEET